jgi:hypothetical protein
MSHPQALEQMVQEKLVAGVNVNDLVLDPSHPGMGSQRTVEVHIASAAFVNPSWPYFGEAQFAYTTLDLGDTFGGLGLRFYMSPQFTSQQLAVKLGQALGIVFEAVDVFQETVTLTQPITTYQFKAGPQSERWTGQVAIDIYRKAGA